MSDRPKLLILAHYYDSDSAATGQIISDIATFLKDDFDITVICAAPSVSGKIVDSYRSSLLHFESDGDIKLIRVRTTDLDKTSKISRGVNIMSYFWGGIYATFRSGKQDIVFAISQPPILGGMLGSFAKTVKRAKYVYNVQDWNPEQIIAANYIKNHAVTKLMMALDKHSCRKSDLVITVGRDLLTTLEKRFTENMPHVTVINNWANEKMIYPLPCDDRRVLEFKKRYDLADKLVFMYSGNVGLYYDIENIVKTFVGASLNKRTPDGRMAVLAVVGNGAKLNSLKEYVENNKVKNVIFIPYQSRELLNISMNAADVHLCVSAKGIKGVSCPSKYYAIASAAKPVLAVLEEGSEIYCLIKEACGGVICEPNDYNGIGLAICDMIQNAESPQYAEMGKRARALIESKYSMEASLEKYRSVLGGLYEQ